jgi:hypothetical protein
MPYREALSVLDEYEERELDKELFRDKLHHLGCGFDGFYKYAQSVKSFNALECSQLLVDRLKFILDQIRGGASPGRSSLKRLIEQSWIEVPCNRYTNCKGHRFDPHCKHCK